MSLRPLLDIALEDEQFRSLASAARERGRVLVHVSPAIRPYLLAALAEATEGLGGRPGISSPQRRERSLPRFPMHWVLSDSASSARSQQCFIFMPRSGL